MGGGIQFPGFIDIKGAIGNTVLLLSNPLPLKYNLIPAVTNNSETDGGI